MSRAQEHLAQANRHIAELTVQIIRQRVIIKYALDTGQRSEMAESLLDALEGSLRLFERHRIFLLSCGALPPGDAATGRSWSRRNGARHDHERTPDPPSRPGLATTPPSPQRAIADTILSKKAGF